MDQQDWLFSIWVVIHHLGSLNWEAVGCCDTRWNSLYSVELEIDS